MPHAWVSLWMRQQHNCVRKYSHGYKSINLHFIEFPCLWLFSRLSLEATITGTDFLQGSPREGRGTQKPLVVKVLLQTWLDCLLIIKSWTKLKSVILTVYSHFLPWCPTTCQLNCWLEGRQQMPNEELQSINISSQSSASLIRCCKEKKMVEADIPTNALVESLCFVLGLMTWKIRVIYIIMSWHSIHIHACDIGSNSHAPKSYASDFNALLYYHNILTNQCGFTGNVRLQRLFSSFVTKWQRRAKAIAVTVVRKPSNSRFCLPIWTFRAVSRSFFRFSDLK